MSFLGEGGTEPSVQSEFDRISAVLRVPTSLLFRSNFPTKEAALLSILEEIHASAAGRFTSIQRAQLEALARRRVDADYRPKWVIPAVVGGIAVTVITAIVVMSKTSKRR